MEGDPVSGERPQIALEGSPVGGEWRQIAILHLSDIHFGAHAFDPPITPGGDRGQSAGFPTLKESVLADISNGTFVEPPARGMQRAIVAITGDVTQRSSAKEFEQAAHFVASLYGSDVFGWTLRARDIFVVPGNHDLVYTEEDAVGRWGRYSNFYRKHAQQAAGPGADAFAPDPDNPAKLTRVIDQSDEGLIVLEINSSAYVRKGTTDERRGQVDHQAIAELKAQLKNIDAAAREASVRVALIHHHPVVLPVLADPNEGYDAIVYSDFLLDLLKSFGFHVVLHGHKHQPYTFSYDPACAWVNEKPGPLMIVAGGSVGVEAQEIPNRPHATNTYNFISIKWHPSAGQARIHIETRGLVNHDSNGKKLLGPEWRWETLHVEDRLVSRARAGGPGGSVRPRDEKDKPFEQARAAKQKELRRNFPALEILPSLRPDQGYEARVWIVGQEGHPDHETPTRVEWSAGPLFSVHVCKKEEDRTFSARFSYWGPTLIQARLYWTADPSERPVYAYIFARYPDKDQA